MLSQAEEDKLQALLNDELLVGIVKKVFNEIADTSKPLLSETDDDKVIGQKYRAYENAKDILEEGFKKLQSYKIERTTGKSFNKAR